MAPSPSASGAPLALRFAISARRAAARPAYCSAKTSTRSSKCETSPGYRSRGPGIMPPSTEVELVGVKRSAARDAGIDGVGGLEGQGNVLAPIDDDTRVAGDDHRRAHRVVAEARCSAAHLERHVERDKLSTRREPVALQGVEQRLVDLASVRPEGQSRGHAGALRPARLP